MSGWTYRLKHDVSPRPPLGLLKETREFGFAELDLVEPPARFHLERPTASPLRTGLDAERVDRDPAPVELLVHLAGDESPMAHSRRALAKLSAWFLLAEDPQRRLEARAVSALAHQASVVRHILSEPHLRSVLLADEVGLGKTVEAGLLVKELLETSPALRVLYLAPAQLVRNVHGELARLGLPFRRWMAGGESDARLSDPLMVASIHRAVHPAHFATFVGTPRWDVIIVDECHHLSDWQRGGGKPTQKYKLVDALRRQLGAAGRLLLMSGTPHQGHPDRFENLLALLRRGDEERSALAGRVIYRTKDDVRDWDGRPLFPQRKVHPPLIVNLGADYKRWLETLHRVFEVGNKEEALGQARRRAFDWRLGQALQWATSSIQAGLGFLVRQALRASWTLERAPLRAALEALRPYRTGAADEPAEHLFERMRLEIGLRDEQSGDRSGDRFGDLEDSDEAAAADADDDEDGDEPRWAPSPAALATALCEGLALLATSADAKWQRIKTEVLDPCDSEKVVLFAQPIETVTALAAYLERLDGKRPAVVIGGQSPQERAAQLEQFWKSDGPRFLVSSKAGGEGLNLQVAHVLVHVDVPWNPMELEQRIGRVHRFLAKRTIQIHTVVVKDSREVHIYQAARRKLEDIAHTMRPEGFEELFARVMSLVPPEELAGVMARGAVGPLKNQEIEELGQLVATGYQRWEQFHEEFAPAQRDIAAVSSGQACWDDLVRFSVDHLDARQIAGVSAHRLAVSEEGEIVEAPEPAEALFIEGEIYACGDYGGTPLFDIRGKRVAQLGLNVPKVLAMLQRLGLGELPSGAFHVRFNSRPAALEGRGTSTGLLFYARSTLSLEGGTYREVGLELLAFAIGVSEKIVQLEGRDLGELVRGLLAAVVRRDAGYPDELLPAMHRANEQLMVEMRRPPPDRSRRYVIFPLVAGVAEAPGRSGTSVF